MTDLEKLRTKKEELLALAERHGAKNLRVFGSVARGDSRPGSDVDFLVDMEEGRTYFDLIDLWLDMQNVLGKKVDVLTEPEVSPYFRQRVVREAVPL